MKRRSRLRVLLASITVLVALLGLAGSGCGEIALPMWIEIDSEQSWAIIDLGDSRVEIALEGGVYAEIDLDTSNLLQV